MCLDSHVDPGFDGRLKFSVYNAGSSVIVVSRGDRLFMMWFSDLDQQTTDLYQGEHRGQMNISSQDQDMLLQGEIASPGQLKQDIDELRASHNNLDHKVNIITAISCALLLGSLLIMLLNLGSQWNRATPQPVTPTPTTQQEAPPG